MNSLYSSSTDYSFLSGKQWSNISIKLSSHPFHTCSYLSFKKSNIDSYILAIVFYKLGGLSSGSIKLSLKHLAICPNICTWNNKLF